MLMMMGMFVCGMLFEHFVFHRMCDKIKDVMHRVNNIFK